MLQASAVGEVFARFTVPHALVETTATWQELHWIFSSYPEATKRVFAESRLTLGGWLMVPRTLHES